jgi:hypothetical protein
MKYENIMLGYDNRFYILDFGEAQLKKVKGYAGTDLFFTPEKLNIRRFPKKERNFIQKPEHDVWGLALSLLLLEGNNPNADMA